jgi:hypothetical protein
VCRSARSLSVGIGETRGGKGDGKIDVWVGGCSISRISSVCGRKEPLGDNASMPIHPSTNEKTIGEGRGEVGKGGSTTDFPGDAKQLSLDRAARWP